MEKLTLAERNCHFTFTKYGGQEFVFSLRVLILELPVPNPKKHHPKKQRPAPRPTGSAKDEQPVGPLRIIGGSMRGRKLLYSGRGDTRPMKERVREAMFNLLGPQIKGLHAVDLFAGTGAIGLEALSRGAARATFIERHIPTAKLIKQNIAALGVQDICEVISANSLIWVRQPGTLPLEPWLVFISPPWSLFQDEKVAMLELIAGLMEQAPPQSMLVVEADMNFDMQLLPHFADWRIRAYAPAVLGIWEQPAAEV
jgi:16S rRNA (guanine966-N2)-methyltransferase